MKIASFQLLNFGRSIPGQVPRGAQEKAVKRQVCYLADLGLEFWLVA